MVKGITRNRLVGFWFAAVAVIIATVIVTGVHVGVATTALLLALSLVPPGIILALWPEGRQPTIRGNPLRDEHAWRPLVIAAARLGCASVGFVLCTQLVSTAPGPHYRDFQLGGDLASVSALAGVSISEAKIIHQRPVLIQELEWRLPYTLTGPSALSPDPVERIVFTFYSDQLFKVGVDYDRNRTEA